MAGSDHLTRLANNLSLDERHNLLEKLTGQSTMTSESLYFEEIGHNVFKDFREHYAALPWYSRLLYFIQSLFNGKTPVTVFEEKLIAELGQKIDSLSPGLYDFQNARLLTPFHARLGMLKESARFFFDALDVGFERDKGAFYAFLGSLEMPEVHKKIIAETEPKVFAERTPDASAPELHRCCFDALEMALQGVTEGHRQQMYASARSLLCLKQISSFLFDRMILAFTHDHSGGQSCPVHAVKDQLILLNNILFSFKTVPSMTLMESLFIFLAQERAGEPGFDINREIHILLTKAESSLTGIMEFNRHIPLTKIIRCGARDMSFVPREISGGEDWFIAYREHWRHYVDTHFSEYMRIRRQGELTKLFVEFFEGKPLMTIQNAASDENPNGFPIRGDFGLSFLLTFYTVIFLPSLNMLLRPILVDGEFASKENEMEFADSYNEFMKLESDIIHLDTKIAHNGDYGERYAMAQHEVAALPVKRRKMQIVIEEASAESLGIIDTVRKAARSLVQIFQGITGKSEHGVNYEGLANMGDFTGKGSTFVENLRDASVKFETVIKILDDINIMEMG